MIILTRQLIYWVPSILSYKIPILYVVISLSKFYVPQTLGYQNCLLSKPYETFSDI